MLLKMGILFSLKRRRMSLPKQRLWLLYVILLHTSFLQVRLVTLLPLPTHNSDNDDNMPGLATAHDSDDEDGDEDEDKEEWEESTEEELSEL